MYTLTVQPGFVYRRPLPPRQLGFAAIVSAAAALAQAGFSAYATVEQMGLAKEQAEVQISLLEQKAELEEKMAKAQMRIAAIQAAGMEERQAIDIEIAQAEAESLRKRLERLDELEAMRLELEKSRIEREKSRIERETLQEAIEIETRIVPTAPVIEQKKIDPLLLGIGGLGALGLLFLLIGR